MNFEEFERKAFYTAFYHTFAVEPKRENWTDYGGPCKNRSS